MRSLSSWRAVFLLGWLVAAGCGRGEATKSAPPALDATLARAVVRTYADMAYAAYSDALELARVLRQRIEWLVAAPTPDALDAARRAWLAARAPYVQTEVYRFYDGPIDAVELLVNTWPIDESYVDNDAPPGPRGLIQDHDNHPVLSEALLEKLNMTESETSVSTGYHVIEFLLWGRDERAEGPGARPYTDFVATSPGSVGARRGQYLVIASKLLLAHLEKVRAEWDPGLSNNYRAHFLALPARDALGRVIKGMGALSGPELAGERLTVAYETKDQENEHSCFSDSTHEDMVGNAKGVENVCLGRYVSAHGRSVAGEGVCALVEATDAALGRLLKEQIAAGVSAARAIPAPFDQAVLGTDEAPGRKAILRTIRALEAQTQTLTRAASLLGLELGLAGAARAEAP